MAAASEVSLEAAAAATDGARRGGFCCRRGGGGGGGRTPIGRSPSDDKEGFLVGSSADAHALACGALLTLLAKAVVAAPLRREVPPREGLRGVGSGDDAVNMVGWSSSKINQIGLRIVRPKKSSFLRIG